MESYSYIFSKNISIYVIFKAQSFYDTFTNDIVSFEQLSPELLIAMHSFLKCTKMSRVSVCIILSVFIITRVIPFRIIDGANLNVSLKGWYCCYACLGPPWLEQLVVFFATSPYLCIIPLIELDLSFLWSSTDWVRKSLCQPSIVFYTLLSNYE